MTTSESKGRFFLQNESIRIDSRNKSNRIDSNRELECSTSHMSSATKVCRYNWHSAGFLGRPFPMEKIRIYFVKIYAEAVLSNSTRKLLWFEITKMLIAV